MILQPPRSTQSRSSAASDVYKRQGTMTERPEAGEQDDGCKATSNSSWLTFIGSRRYQRASSVNLLATCPTSASAVFRARDHRDSGAAQEPIPTPPGSREAQPPRGYSFGQPADPSSRRP